MLRHVTYGLGTTLRSGQKAPNNDRRSASYRKIAARQRQAQQQRAGGQNTSPTSTPGAVLDQTTGRSYETTSSEVGKLYSSNEDAVSPRFIPIASTNQAATIGATYGLQEQQTFSSKPVQGPSADGGFSSRGSSGSSNRESADRPQAAGPLFVNEKGRENLEKAGRAIQDFGEKVSGNASQQSIRQDRVIGNLLGRTIYETGALVEKIGAKPKATTLELAGGSLLGAGTGVALERSILLTSPTVRPFLRNTVNIGGAATFGVSAFTAPRGEIGRSVPFVTGFGAGFSKTFSPSRASDPVPDDGVFSLGGAKKLTKAEMRKRSFNQQYNPNIFRGNDFVQERTPRSFRSVEIVQDGLRLTKGSTRKTGAGTDVVALRTSLDTSGRRFNQEFIAGTIPKGDSASLGGKAFARPPSQLKTNRAIDKNELIVLQQQGFKGVDFSGQKRISQRQELPKFNRPSESNVVQLLEQQSSSSTRFVPRTGGQRVVTKREQRLEVLKEKLRERQRLRFEEEARQKQLVPQQNTRSIQRESPRVKTETSLAPKTEFLPATKYSSRSIADASSKFSSLSKSSSRYFLGAASRLGAAQLPRSAQMYGAIPVSLVGTDVQRALDYPSPPAMDFSPPIIPSKQFVPPSFPRRPISGGGSEPIDFIGNPRSFNIPSPPTKKVAFPLPPLLREFGALGKSGSSGGGGKQQFLFRRSLTGIEKGLKPKKGRATGYSGLEVR